MTIRTRPILSTLLMAGVVAFSQIGGPTSAGAVARPPNILFIILDDVGRDQLASFNPAAATAALTPTLNAIAAAGVKFTNLYTMPECSPSRAAFFTGRYPLRTGVTAAILDQDLPAAHVSPFETTTPRVLATAGYGSALLGKYHLGGPENNPDGNRAPEALGWEYFNGNLRGGPPSIDTTLGGQYTRDKEKYSCGFPTGPARGAAWFQGRQVDRCDDNNRAGYTGQEAVALGAIPLLDGRGNFAATCADVAGRAPDLNRPNGYYVWPHATLGASGLETRRSREYMTTVQTDTAIEWIQAPYDPTRAKGTAYKTCVTAPLIVAGPLVVGPGRSVAHQVNAVDLFQLFGEIAGVDVRAVVPPTHVLDAEPMLPYLTNPNQPSVRKYNFTQLGTGLKPPSVTLWPCVIRIGPINLATDILFTSQTLCQDDFGGTWFGPTADQPVPQYPTSCAVRASGLYNNLTIVPTRVWALRNGGYKLVKLERAPCDSSLGEYELYDLSPRPPANPLGLDISTANLLTNGQPIGVTAAQAANFAELSSQLQTLLNSETVCHGDGNLDKRVDILDQQGVTRYMGGPSVFDFSQDGVTGSEDMRCVQSNFGNDCRVRGPGTACR